MKLSIYMTTVTYSNGVYKITFPDFPGVEATEFDRKEVSLTAEEILTLHAGKIVAAGKKLPNMIERGMYGRDEFADADFVDFVVIAETEEKAKK